VWKNEGAKLIGANYRPKAGDIASSCLPSASAVNARNISGNSFKLLDEKLN
jgi:hypothetical protein